MKKYDCIYFSPHLDDAVFSCGGKIIKDVKVGKKIIVITIFAGRSYTQRPFSLREGVLNNTRSFKDIDKRKKEDREVLTNLKVDFIHWRFLDAIFRKPKRNLSFPMDEYDRRLMTSIFKKINKVIKKAGFASISARVFFPLAIGDHVDHKIIFKVGIIIKKKNPQLKISFYEDFPYAALVKNPKEIDARIRKHLLKPRLIDITDFFDKKFASICSYSSQIRPNFKNRNKLHTLLKKFHGSYSGSKQNYYERYWYF